MSRRHLGPLPPVQTGPQPVNKISQRDLRVKMVFNADLIRVCHNHPAVEMGVSVDAQIDVGHQNPQTEQHVGVLYGLLDGLRAELAKIDPEKLRMALRER